MLDIKLIRERPEEVKKALLKRMDHVDFTELLRWDQERRDLISKTTKLREEQKRVSAQIPKLKKEGKDTGELIPEMKKLSGTIKSHQAELDEVEGKIRAFIEVLPNLPAGDVPAGDKEKNVVVRTGGERRRFSFKPKDHIQLVSDLGLVDYKRGVKLGGNGFWLYRGEGAALEWALLNYFIEYHVANGYELILPPHLLVRQCGFTAGQFPKFAGDVFHIKEEGGEGRGRFLLPTAETALINFHRDEILKEGDLPLKYVAYTPCYRKEAGSYRKNERGMIRGHQFNKVEIFQYTRPEDSNAALEDLTSRAEKLVGELGLHYRVSKLAASDTSAAMAKTYDIEVWIPSMEDYKEVSSASNARDYQARRGNIRFKRKGTGKNEYIHSLNASGLATSRLLPAIVEQFQQSDGSVLVPEVIQERLGRKVLRPLK